MALIRRKNDFIKIFRNLHRLYSQKNDESLYQKEERGKEPKIIYGEPYPDWRKHWVEREDEWRSKLSAFNMKGASPDFLAFMSKLPDMTTDHVKEWWTHMKEIKEIANQQYLAKRVEILGANLAAAHFFTYRGASVRMKGSKDWFIGNPDEIDLPKRFTEGFYVEAIDCANFKNGGLRFEGAENLNELTMLKWLSLKNNILVNVWTLDRIAGLNGESLEYLDVSGCPLDIGCVYAISRMKNLKVLVITDPEDNVALHSAFSLLEEESPVFIKMIPKEDVAVQNEDSN